MKRFFLKICLFYLSIICATLAMIGKNGNGMGMTSSPLLTRHHIRKINETFTSLLLPSDRAKKGRVITNYFNQFLDHFTDGEKTYWRQKFFVDATYSNANTKDVKPPPPKKTKNNPSQLVEIIKRIVFLLIGGEGRIDETFSSFGLFSDLAAEYFALCMNLEHRFYGESQPFDDLSMENLKYLTVAQALEDFAEFIRKMRVKGDRWIVFGGSYAGTLAAWTQRKYPHLVYGAVASSAVFPKKTVLPEYYERLADALTKISGSHKCFNNLQMATDSLLELMDKDGGCEEIAKLFNVEPPDFCGRPLDVSIFFRHITIRISTFLSHINNDPYIILCKQMKSKKIAEYPVDRLAHLWKMLNDFETCTMNYDKVIDLHKSTEYDPVLNIRQWKYQLCTELGNLPTLDSPNQPFGNKMDKAFVIQTCQDIYGQEYNETNLQNGISNILNDFGGSDTFYDKTVFTVGEFDFWFDTHTNKEINNVIMIEGGHHCDDFGICGQSDSIQLKKAITELKIQVMKLVDGTYFFLPDSP